MVFVVVFVSLCWSLCLCVGLLCDCVTAKAIPGLLTFSHFCRRRYSWRLTIIRTKATSVTTIEIEKPYSVKLKLPNCTIFFAHCHSLSNCHFYISQLLRTQSSNYGERISCSVCFFLCSNSSHDYPPLSVSIVYCSIGKTTNKKTNTPRDIVLVFCQMSN